MRVVPPHLVFACAPTVVLSETRGIRQTCVLTKSILVLHCSVTRHVANQHLDRTVLAYCIVAPSSMISALKRVLRGLWYETLV